MPSKKYYFLQISEEKFFDNPRVNALSMENPQFIISLQRLILKANKSNEPGLLVFDEAFCSMEEQISAMLSCSLEYASSFCKACRRRKIFEDTSLGISIPIAKELTASRTERADDMKERRATEKNFSVPQIGFNQNDSSTTEKIEYNCSRTDDHKMITNCEKCSTENKDYRPESIEQNLESKKQESSPIKKSRKEKKNSDASNESSGIRAVCRKIVDYLNKKTGKSFKSSTKDTQRLINARLNEGFKEEDFKSVIDVKTGQWLNDGKMARYLRPQTLFGTKMDAYLQEAKVSACKRPAMSSNAGIDAQIDLGDHVYFENGPSIKDTFDRSILAF